MILKLSFNKIEEVFGSLFKKSNDSGQDQDEDQEN